MGDYENQIFVRLRNDGVGPMIIEKVIVTHSDRDGEPKLVLIDFMPNMPKAYPSRTFVHDISRRAISPENRLTLILFDGDLNDKKFVQLRK